MHQAASNVNDKMWVFWDKEFNASVTDHDEQQLTLEMRHVEYDSPFFLIVVYAKCKPILGRPLWEVLRHKSATYDSPWCVIGDFNVIASVEEKIGGIPYQMNKSLDFHCMIEDCGLVDLGFYGPKCTWSNGRVSHLASAGSDHTPLLMEMRVRQENSTKYFKFLNLWVDNPNFKPFIQGIWDNHVTGSPMWIFHQKLKSLSAGLSQWSRQEYGDIFQKAKEYEEKVKVAEMVWAQTNDEIDRWFKDGDANTKYFHSLIRGKRRMLYIHKIRDEDGQWIQGDEAIGSAACDFYQDLFTDPGGPIREDLLPYRTLSELKEVVFSMNPTSAAGPDGFNGKFYQS
ncbi:PREDICTED: uncharacterized protein LOC109241590 [Nicotiana attenuata]|uniref:uncharacterized protein LOC109241590 n=1 Tax=Nicotiana attenuata TaxID=49451 RepID=UPI00090582A0|nr:PREDICTED: uncharacterized protein LOC109241590 [Nicotiana attenuata]